MNPGSIMKIMNAKTSCGDTSKVCVIFNRCMSGGITEGTIIEVTVTKPGEAPVTANMKVQASDIELVNELKNLK